MCNFFKSTFSVLPTKVKLYSVSQVMKKLFTRVHNLETFKPLILLFKKQRLWLLLLQDHPGPLNIIADSQPVGKLLTKLDTVTIALGNDPVNQLFKTLQDLLHQKKKIQFILLTSDLLISKTGWLTEGNAAVDKLVAAVFEDIQDLYNLTHLNSRGLCCSFPISRKQAQLTVFQCTACSQCSSQRFPECVQPQEFHPYEIWQIDITHIPVFCKLA